MRTLFQKITNFTPPEAFVDELGGDAHAVLLRSASFDATPARYSFVAPFPFLQVRVSGSRCEFTPFHGAPVWEQFGNPWQILEELTARYEILDEADLPFPLGGCFGYWGYDLKNSVEPRLPRRAVNDLELPDAVLGFYDALLVYDHHLRTIWIISTGMKLDGSRDEAWAQERLRRLKGLLAQAAQRKNVPAPESESGGLSAVTSNFSRAEFIERV